MRKNLPLQIVIAIGGGVVAAYLSVSMGISRWVMDWIYPWGEVFIRLLKLVALPLILFSIVSGIVQLKDMGTLSRMGIRVFLLYLFTTLVAITVGLLLANLIRPGEYADAAVRYHNRILYEKWAAENHIPLADHQCVSCKDGVDSQKPVTEMPTDVREKLLQFQQQKNRGPLRLLVDIVPDNIFFALQNNGAMLQIIFFSLLLGIALIRIQKNSHIVVFTEQMNSVFLAMVEMIMNVSPFFVFALMTGEIVKMAGDNMTRLNETLLTLLYYAATVLLGLFMMLLGVYPLLLKLYLGKEFNYTVFFRHILPAQLLAFSSSSSAATLPVTMECVEKNLRVKPQVASFVLPIGATVNMDGTSLYQSVAVVFLAQWNDIHLSLYHQLMIVLTALLGSVGAAAVPGAGLIMLIMMLESVGLNPAWISVIMPVDRLLDMFRTVVNVTSDITISYLINKFFSGEKRAKG